MNESLRPGPEAVAKIRHRDHYEIRESLEKSCDNRNIPTTGRGIELIAARNRGNVADERQKPSHKQADVISPPPRTPPHFRCRVAGTERWSEIFGYHVVDSI